MVVAMYKSVAIFQKVVKVFALQNGFRLKKVKNEKSRVTLTCAIPSCILRIHSSLNWNRKHVFIETFRTEHIYVRGNGSCKANSTWIPIIILHLFRANPQLNIEIIPSELFRRFCIKYNNHQFRRTKNKALELLRQNHKANYTKLYRYMNAILNSNLVSTIIVNRNWLGGGQNYHFKRFFMMFDASMRRV